MCTYNTPETTLFRSTMVPDIPAKAGIIQTPPPPPPTPSPTTRW